MSGALAGLKAPLAGIRFLRTHPNLLRWYGIPVLINTVVYVAGGWVFFAKLPDILGWVFENPDAWWERILYYALGVVIGAIFGLILLFTFTAVGLVIAGPFLEVLSEKIDAERLGTPAPDGLSFLADIPRIVGTQIRFLLMFLFVQAVCIVIYFIPVLGQIVGAPLQLFVTAYFFAWEFWDIPLERRKLDFRAKRNFVSANLGAALAFGAVISLYMFVPLLNFIMMPASVAGATILVGDIVMQNPALAAPSKA
ncbi:EI24 domain-containing protein [bacterium]|nr:EI24 domain-containing protein [bacterium]